jgi:hypothetical protein
VAKAALDTYAPDGTTFAWALGLSLAPDTATQLGNRVLEKLTREPVEDYRVDFEDGYGVRPDAEEDGHAEAVGSALVEAGQKGTLPPFVGIRIKPSPRRRPRAVRCGRWSACAWPLRREVAPKASPSPSPKSRCPSR